MGMGDTATSPKHGFAFDGYEYDVRRGRKSRRCMGAVAPRSMSTGVHADDCTETIEPGDLYLATVVDLYIREAYTCIPCALAAGKVTPV